MPLEGPPPGICIVHNDVARKHPPDYEGVQVWLQHVDEEYPALRVCKCGWAPHLKKHHRVRGFKLLTVREATNGRKYPK
jgi:hypothetical protein